nr:uncharacterized protein LOC127314878 [Lolium perenne]
MASGDMPSSPPFVAFHGRRRAAIVVRRRLSFLALHGGEGRRRVDLVCRVAMAAGCDLTVDLNRGVAPADEDSSGSKSRLLRWVAHAATSTRCPPLQVRFGDIVAAWVIFVLHSGGATAAARAVAELSRQRGSQGLGCNLLFFRILSVNFGTSVLFLDTSCIFGFLV